MTRPVQFVAALLGSVPSRHRAAALVAALLAGLGVGVPLVNADAGPPRALFLHLPPELPEPVLALDARPSPTGRWRLEIAAAGFRFTGVCVAAAAATPVGHAHVLLDGAKIASAFTPVVDLGPLPPGAHTFRVILRGQDHRSLVGRHGLIQADITVTVPDGAEAGHG